ncbi:MAG TPA: diguanylate cyclase, partial [Acidimicrobiales bacterium]|nr:diguanylate cyclase [Acidimicrobiales bacterium]
MTALLSYLDRAGGPELAHRALSDAGCPRRLDELRSRRWGPRDELLAVAEAAAALTGDPDLGRRAGEEMFRMTVADAATRAFFLSAGSPAAALDGVLEYTVKMGRGRSYRVASRDGSGCVIQGDYYVPDLGHPFFCGLSLGYWPMIASLFGAVGTGYHPSCQCRGDEFCTFVIHWDRGAGADGAEVAAAGAELRRRIGTFESIQAVAEDLARAADLPELAERILNAVDAITPAPALLVAIRGDAGKSPVIARRGLSPRTAQDLAERLLDGSYTGSPRLAAMARVGEFGVLAAIAPDAEAVSETSSKLLESFARHAGARVEAVLSRQQAEESRQTASALLELAASLAGTTTEREVSECLARAIPTLAAADRSTVLRWYPESHTLRTVAFVGPPGLRPHQEYAVAQVPALYELASRPSPFVLDRSRADPYVARAMSEWGERFDVIVPLIEQGDFLGFLCAGYSDEIALDTQTAFSRLQGAADLAATAFTKARLLEEIRHQALHDDLTGLPNRTLLEDRARQSLREARRHNRRVGLLFLDLDQFKHVNDSMGHKFGDAIIQAAATRIRASLRESDVFSRMGGDEFVILLHDVNRPEDAAHVAAKILEDLRQPFDMSGQSLYLSASIGVAVFPEDGEDYSDLLQAADSSMYAAKSAGRNTVSRQAAPAQKDGDRTLDLEAELRQAIHHDQLRVVYQPQVAMADLKLVGVEALVRWKHPRLGLLLPDEFLPLAGRCGLMAALDRLVRRRALRQASEWHRSVGSLIVSVNMSPQSVRHPDLLDEIAADLEDLDVHPGAIEFEVTEAMLADDEIIPVVDGLTAMGMRVAVDDLATGGSTFARLQKLPFHTIKIN